MIIYNPLRLACLAAVIALSATGELPWWVAPLAVAYVWPCENRMARIPFLTARWEKEFAAMQKDAVDRMMLHSKEGGNA